MISLIIYRHGYPHRFNPASRLNEKQQWTWLTDVSRCSFHCDLDIWVAGICVLWFWVHLGGNTRVFIAVNVCVNVYMRDMSNMCGSTSAAQGNVFVCSVHVSICTPQIRIWRCCRIKAPVGKVDTDIKEPETLTRRQGCRNNTTWGWMKENLNNIICAAFINSLSSVLPHSHMLVPNNEARTRSVLNRMSWCFPNNKVLSWNIFSKVLNVSHLTANRATSRFCCCHNNSRLSQTSYWNIFI